MTLTSTMQTTGRYFLTAKSDAVNSARPTPVDLLVSVKSLIESVVNVFETGTPEGDYSLVTIYPDGPGGRRQITYGRSQTTEYGNLPVLLRQYAAAGGRCSDSIAAKLPLLGTGKLLDDLDFLQTLRAAGQDPIMQKCQDQFFDSVYWTPALTWAEAGAFTLPLSMLVIYDSFIQSGRILQTLRVQFAEAIPSRGGSERDWIEQYTQARHRWLLLHPRVELQKSAYRTRCFLEQIDRGNWQLNQLPIRANGVLVGAPQK